MINLWEETIKVLESYGKKWKHVTNVYCEHFSISKENFEALATKTNYDNGYGTAYVADDLMIKGSDFILIREEYDGAEGWRYVPTLPPTTFKEVHILEEYSEYKLADMNNINTENCIEYKEED